MESQHRLDGLDVWRGIAALMVAMYHFNVNSLIHDIFLIKNSWLFVEFFFVLSGFIMMYTYSGKILTKEQLNLFLFKRFSRIWPLHIFILLLFVPVALAGYFIGSLDSARFSFSAFASNIFLVQSLGLNDGVTWNSPSWSISSEFWVYVAFGILNLSITKGVLRFIVVSLTCLAILFAFSNMGDAYKLAFFRCGYSFFLGCVVFYFFKCNKIRSGTLVEALSLLSVLILMSCFYIDGDDFFAYFMPILFCFMIFAFARGHGRVSGLINNRFLIKLGKFSYSIYMTHAFVAICIKSCLLILGKLLHQNYLLKIGNETQIDLGNPMANNVIDILFILIVISLSSFTYKYIESNVQKRLNLWYRDKTTTDTNDPQKGFF